MDSIKALVLIFSLIALGLFFSAIQNESEYREARRSYCELRKECIAERTTAAEKSISFIDEKTFRKLNEMNPDIIGWIYVPGTELNYPLLKCSDNSEYLFSSYKGEYCISGSIFVDFRCTSDLSDEVTVIYGHNMHDGTMFGMLDSYLSEDFRKEHAELFITLKDAILKYSYKDCGEKSVGDGCFDLPKKTDWNNETGNVVLVTCTEDSSETERFTVTFEPDEIRKTGEKPKEKKQ